MATRSRIAPNIDMGRLRAALSGPGADPRTWCFEGRIDDDPDAIRWDEKLGWLCDVTVTGGQLDGEGPVTCRVDVPFATDGFGGPFHPPKQNANVTVTMPSADLNSNPIITGYVFDDDAPVPTAFGDLEANEDNLKTTHAMKSPHDVDMEFGGKLTLSFGESMQVDAQSLNLLGASQAFVRGDDLKSALDSWSDSLVTALRLITAGSSTTGGAPAATAMEAANIILVQALTAALSTKIKGE